MNGGFDGANFLLTHISLVCACLAALYIGTRPARTAPEQPAADASSAAALSELKSLYLVPYVLALSGDWMQGPYQFKVYLEYGLSEGQIGMLYICGFGSSMLCGTYTASLMDRWGRRTGCLVYCLICSLSCLTKNFGSYEVLLFGRALGGVAASLLFAAFESWCVTHAGRMKLDPQALASLFSTASFANGLTAIASAVVGHACVATFGTVVAPFNLVPFLLAACAFLIYTRWEENYGAEDGGDEEGGGSAGEAAGGFLQGVKYVLSEPKVWLLGTISSLFDAAVYVFIFLWTLSLDARNAGGVAFPYGIAFAVFMGWCMVGAYVAEIVLLPSKGVEIGVRGARGMAILLGCAAAGFLPGLDPGTSFAAVFNGFCLLEFAFGAFMPIAAYLRSVHLSDANRTTATALYRVPTNVAVCSVLYFAESLSEAAKAGVSISLLAAALLASVSFLYLGGGKAQPAPPATN
eukprot:TRINITY_DN6903_c1_g4_i1.p1 TRINITY_DN6903_c1_g4~~TRINITY_DN6903_c1_g4_i1.p1  ORF type:complete len:464 (+),score=159.56 TRINITY_DN6903_c1_g4_i1:93-1484(+)